MTSDDREIWDDLDNDDDRLEAYAGVIEERNALRRPVAAVYERFKHLDRVFEMVGDSDGTENTDPFHMAARDLWRAVKASLGIPVNDKLSGGEAVRSDDLLPDARRLDWLDEVNRRTNERNGTVYGWRFDINHNRAALSDHNLPALTVRQAIDEAMKANAHALAEDRSDDTLGGVVVLRLTLSEADLVRIEMQSACQAGAAHEIADYDRVRMKVLNAIQQHNTTDQARGSRAGGNA